MQEETHGPLRPEHSRATPDTVHPAPARMLEPNDVKEELSLAYVRAIASRGGFAVEEVRRDRDGIDVHVHARGLLVQAALESPVLGVQLKATARDLRPEDDRIPFDLKIKNYDDLTKITLIPRVLVVFLLPEDPEQWVTCSDEALVLRRSAYWLSLRGLPTTANQSTERVHVPRNQIFDTPCVRRLLERVAREEEIGT